MAIYHFKLSLIRRRDGQSAVAAAAYRAGERIDDQRTGRIHDYSRKSGVVDTGFEGWSATRSDLWNAAEIAERHPRAIVAREIVVALPHELTAADRRTLVVDFARYLRDRHGVVVDWAIQAPTARSPRNDHAHLMLTTRVVADHDQKLGAKSRELDVSDTGAVHLAHWRSTWAARVNERLWLAGFEREIDHRSHKAAGRGQEPLRHLGPTMAALEAKGVATAAGRDNRARRRRNRERRLIDAQLRLVRRSIDALLQSAVDFVTDEPHSRAERARGL
jgi:hypothetical protein